MLAVIGRARFTSIASTGECTVSSTASSGLGSGGEDKLFSRGCVLRGMESSFGIGCGLAALDDAGRAADIGDPSTFTIFLVGELVPLLD